MFRIFRKLRFEKLKEFQYGRFIGYVVLEVFLVVIGILIALDFNDRSIMRNNRMEEIKICKELNEDLEFNLVELNTLFSSLEGKSRNIDSILYYIMNDVPHDSTFNQRISRLPSNGIFNMSTTTYEYVKNKGVNVISSDTLRKSLMIIYDLDFYNIKYRESTMTMIRSEMLLPTIFELFGPEVISEGDTTSYILATVPNNYEELKKNTNFQNKLMYYKRQVDIRIRWLPDSKNEILNLIDLINSHITYLESNLRK